LGGFGAFYQLSGYKNLVLVLGADGVSTKLRLALDYKKYSSIGIDCFAMCANDILCNGSKTLFFLDYTVCSKLNADIALCRSSPEWRALARLPVQPLSEGKLQRAEHVLIGRLRCGPFLRSRG